MGNVFKGLHAGVSEDRTSNIRNRPFKIAMSKGKSRRTKNDVANPAKHPGSDATLKQVDCWDMVKYGQDLKLPWRDYIGVTLKLAGSMHQLMVAVEATQLALSGSTPCFVKNLEQFCAEAAFDCWIFETLKDKYRANGRPEVSDTMDEVLEVMVQKSESMRRLNTLCLQVATSLQGASSGISGHASHDRKNHV
ncbi:hypothetical protein CC2G_003712 [Coprinopsis cinerea AmutBmut pab1-1]|nr:hypothetical protein CC2G_003712 [Coprinopsis cinerea AmutBmut pab1-1]